MIEQSKGSLQGKFEDCFLQFLTENIPRMHAGYANHKEDWKRLRTFSINDKREQAIISEKSGADIQVNSYWGNFKADDPSFAGVLQNSLPTMEDKQLLAFWGEKLFINIDKENLPAAYREFWRHGHQTGWTEILRDQLDLFFSRVVPRITRGKLCYYLQLPEVSIKFDTTTKNEIRILQIVKYYLIGKNDPKEPPEEKNKDALISSELAFSLSIGKNEAKLTPIKNSFKFDIHSAEFQEEFDGFIKFLQENEKSSSARKENNIKRYELWCIAERLKCDNLLGISDAIDQTASPNFDYMNRVFDIILSAAKSDHPLQEIAIPKHKTIPFVNNRKKFALITGAVLGLGIIATLSLISFGAFAFFGLPAVAIGLTGASALATGVSAAVTSGVGLITGSVALLTSYIETQKINYLYANLTSQAEEIITNLKKQNSSRQLEAIAPVAQRLGNEATTELEAAHKVIGPPSPPPSPSSLPNRPLSPAFLRLPVSLSTNFLGKEINGGDDDLSTVTSSPVLN